jgi:hypothetical protein
VTYSLTGRGEELHEVLSALSGIAQRWKAADAARLNGHGSAATNGNTPPAAEPVPAVASPSGLG